MKFSTPLLGLLLLLALAACSPAAEAVFTDAPTPPPAVAPTAITVTDGMQKPITLEQYPQRIVSLSPSTTEILFAIGAGAQVAGREETAQYPAAAQAVTSVGSLWGGLPTEAILALEPDLVIVAEIITAEQVQALEDLGLTVFWQANPETFEALFQNIMDLAMLTGHTAEAEILVTGLRARVAAVTEAVSGAEDRPTVFYEVDATDPANPYSAGAGTFIDTIITLAGGSNVARDLGLYPQISAESLIAMNPQVILLADAPYGVTPESVAARPGWEVIQAVQDGTIYGVDPFVMSVPGPRLVDGLEAAARLLHPELFE